MQRTPHDLMRTYLVDVAQAGNLDLIDELAHEDMVDEANLAFGGPPGREGLKAHVRGFNRHVTEATFEIRAITGDAREVMAHWCFEGLHSGPWLGRAATNTRINGTVFSFFELDAGRIRRYRLWLHATLNPPVTFDSSLPLDVQGLA